MLSAAASGWYAVVARVLAVLALLGPAGAAGADDLHNHTPPASQPSTAPVLSHARPDDVIASARRLCDAGHHARAAALLRGELKRWPESASLWQALIDVTLEREQYGLALRLVQQARSSLDRVPAKIDFLAARAYFGLGRVLGETRIREVPGGRVGQFADDWVLIERRGETERFLCCPKASAMYALRQALEAGVDDIEAYCLLARIWCRAGRPELGLAILRQREAIALAESPPKVLAAFADVALDANDLAEYLRYSQVRAKRDPSAREEILYDAYRTAAERYNERGDEAMFRELLRRALAIRADDADLMLRLADAIWNAHDQAEADRWYRRVLDKKPLHPQRKRILERLAE